MSKEFWEKYDKMTDEERKKFRQTQWASAMQDSIRVQEERARNRKRTRRESLGHSQT